MAAGWASGRYQAVVMAVRMPQLPELIGATCADGPAPAGDRPADLPAAPGEQPAVGHRVVAQPEGARRHVPPGRGRHPPAPPRDRLSFGALLALLTLRTLGPAGPRRRVGLGSRSLQYRQHRVEPLAPYEPGRLPVDQPDFHRLRSNPAHRCSLKCTSVRSRARASPVWPGPPARPFRYPRRRCGLLAPSATQGKVGSYALVRKYIR